MKSKILKNIHDSVKKLHKNKIVDSVTMRKFDELCLDIAEPLSKTAIKELRRREKVSQPVFAKFLNVSASTVKKWETGEKKPSGAALRLLQIVKDHGIAIIINDEEQVENDDLHSSYKKALVDSAVVHRSN